MPSCDNWWSGGLENRCAETHWGSSPSLGAICLVRRAYGILVSYICSTRLDKHRSSYRTLCIISPICKRLEGSFIGRPGKVYTL